MAEKEELENRLYERMSQENEKYLADLKTKSPDEIISHAYEIACRDNLLILFEHDTTLSPRQLATLLEFEHPLAQLYDDWLNRDTDEMENFRDSVECCADDILKHRAEEKYSDPHTPQYDKTLEQARACDEVPEWRANHLRNTECARVFDKRVAIAYHNEQFQDFLRNWVRNFGKDRCMFILSCTIAARDGDERFYPTARQAAARYAAQRDLVGGCTSYYITDVHSCIVNGAMEYLARPERSKAQENTQPKKKSQQQAR